MSEWSVPESEVMDVAGDLLDEGADAMLATVVDVRGSAYRRPGAKMVVTPGEGGVGAITAGCLEDEVRRLARGVLDTGDARVETYDLMTDDDVWGMGVGCNGVLDVLLEPLDDSFRRAVDAYAAGDDTVVYTVIASDDDRLAVGDRAYADALDGFPPDVAAALEDRDPGGSSHAATVDTDRGTATVFVDVIDAPADFVVVGTGHDARPVVDLAARMDFSVTVAGFRGAKSKAERFPAADAVVSTSPRSLTDDVDIDADTVVVVMTHNYVDDRLAVEALLDTDAPYVGLMGPDDRFQEMLGDFADEDVTFTDAQLDRVYTPVGLDLGGGAPEQVALSIVAEALAVHNDRTGGSLRRIDGHIHDRPAADD
ncbi:XdhC family protein [Halocalculus aciditolerans]|uniref:Xanthine dehydrogenase accessory factor n=1 Tax=Halocalculus aciditolerans TaxID=1383812 RepID=A0A830F9H2_9EURY|nr:XdhC/CoxI family protein [Halocalculus aciditolerans]GGL67713.1 xanthine dehydrogenase accessory factor [Halocalculus aciditolerans]